MITIIEGFNEGQVSELNRMRHIMWASLSAMGSKVTPRQLLPLPVDGMSDAKPVTQDEFLALAKKMADLDKAKRAKA